MTRATIETVGAGGGERALATEDIGGGEVALTTDPPTAEQVDGFDIVDFIAVNSPLAEGSMGFVATIENTGNSSDTQDVTLTIDGTAEETRSVSLDAGNTTNVPLRWSDAGSSTPGFYTATVSTADDSESITVEIVDDAFSIRKDPDLGPVLVVEASISAFDNQSGGLDTTEADATYDGINVIELTPEFDPAGTKSRSDPNPGSRTWRLNEAETDTTLADMFFDTSGDQVDGSVTEGELAQVDASAVSGTVQVVADDGLATLAPA
jgi:hypothetical protein